MNYKYYLETKESLFKKKLVNLRRTMKNKYREKLGMETNQFVREITRKTYLSRPFVHNKTFLNSINKKENIQILGDKMKIRYLKCLTWKIKSKIKNLELKSARKIRKKIKLKYKKVFSVLIIQKTSKISIYLKLYYNKTPKLLKGRLIKINNKIQILFFKIL